MEVFCKYCKSR